MDILFFTDNFPPEVNAIASRVFERACYWVKWGHSVTIITSVPNFPEGKVYPGYKNRFYQNETMEGIHVVRIKTFIAKNKGFLFRTLDFVSYIFPAFIAGMLQKKPDVIIATTPQFFVSMPAWWVAIFKRSSFILEIADIWPASIIGVGAMKKNILIQILEKIELFLYQKAVALIVLTPAFKENLISRNIPKDKIFIVINGVDLAKFKPIERSMALAQKINLPPNSFVIGYIGTHGMAHALMNVLQAAEKLIAYADILFLFVGAGAERDNLIHYAQQRNLTNVKFIESQPKSIIQQFWSLCHVALIHLKNDPVFREVIPSKIFEAMGMGLPLLLAAPQGEASKIILQEKVGIRVPAENPESLAQAVVEFYQNKKNRLELAENSQKTAFLYSREKQAREILNVISISLKAFSP